MIFLVELGVHDGVAASTLYVSTDGYTTEPIDAPSNQSYTPRISNAGSIERAMFSSGSGGVTTSGPSQVGFGNISVVNGRPYTALDLIDNWVTLSFRDIIIRSLIDRTQAFFKNKVRFVGRIEQLVSTNALEQYDLVMYDRLRDFDKVHMVNRYGGTTTGGGMGTADGNEDLKDQAKPKLYGTVHNVPCVAANPFDLIYQVNDGPVNTITVYDGGVALTGDGDNGTLAALLAAVINPGHYRTCLAEGLFRLGGSPAGTLTADVVEGATAALRSPAQIVSRMVAWHQAMYPSPTVAIAAGSVAAVDAINHPECGVLLSDGETTLAGMARVLNSISAWFLPVIGSTTTFEMGVFDSPSGTPVVTYDLDDNLEGNPERIESGDQGNGVPAYKITVRYDQLGTTQSPTDLFGFVLETPARVAYLGQEWRQVVAQDNSILTQWPNAAEITFDTCLVNLADATAAAARLLAIHKVRRDIYRLTVPMSEDPAEDPELGEVVELISKGERMGLGTEAGTGKLFTTIARQDQFIDNPNLVITLWG